MKHTFIVLILLIGISAMVLGQTDTSTIRKNNKKSPQLEEESYKFQLGTGYFTLADRLISSDTYSGNGITASFIVGYGGDKYHSDTKIYLSYAHRLKSSFFDENSESKALQDLQYLRWGIQGSYELRIAKSKHFLGGYFNLPIENVYNSRFEDMSPYISTQIASKIYNDRNFIVPLSLGGSYFYADHVLGMPVKLNATLPIPIPLKKNRVWRINTYYSFECSLSVYRNDGLDFLLMYNWNYSSLSKMQDLIHQYKVGSNALSLVISFI